MKRKGLSLICALIVLVCLLSAVTVQAQTTTTGTFNVGYSRVDINAYIDPSLTGAELVAKENIMALPLRGSGDVWNRLSTYGLVDDNGDGYITSEDGLKVTTIAVSDDTGKTVLLITVDLIGGSMINQVRTAVAERLEEAQLNGELTDVDLSADGIYYAGTHTHEAPDVTVYSSKGKVGTNNDGVDLSIINENLGIWIDRTVANIAESAILALKDRAPATLTKDEIDASEAQSAVVKGKVMNTVRHYVNEAGGCVAGDNFNSRGTDPKQITQVNDIMYLLQFDFTDYNKTANEKKLNIILANWRGHPSMNASNDFVGGSRNCFSSDYISSFRHALEYCAAVKSDGTAIYDTVKHYRVSFFQAASGNVNPRGREVVDGKIVGKWIDDMAKNNKEGRGNGYGRVLYALAYEGIMTSKNREAVDGGKILTTQYVYNSNRNTIGISALAYEAGKAYQAIYAANPNDSRLKPTYVHTNAVGETYVVGSRFHASSLVSRWDTTLQEAESDLVDMELNVFMLGKDVAFVTAPGEPFDYYYNEDGSNAWFNLVDDDLYGTPFVLGYCNGAKGYIPNSKAYDYNLGSTKWVRGSYETSITPYHQGAGEHMIDLFEDMLDTLSAGKTFAYEGTCSHCEGTVTWQPYNGIATLHSGHYYLRGNENTQQIHIAPGDQVCFDLNGYTLKGETRAFYTAAGAGTVLNIMDHSPAQTGTVVGVGASLGVNSGFNGGAIIIDSTNICNLYSGTLTMLQSGVNSVYMGGVVRNKGTFNMYGGVITGGVASHFTGTYLKNGVPTVYSREGRAAQIHSSGTFNLYGGRIDAGRFQLITGIVEGDAAKGYSYRQTVEPVAGKGVALYSTGNVYISGDAQIADICFDGSSEKLLHLDTSEGSYTGSFQLTFVKALSDSLVLGSCTEGTVLNSDTISFGNGALTAQVSGGQLVATTGAAILKQDGSFQYYSTFQDAYNNYSYNSKNPAYIKLYTDVTERMALGRTVYLDLNGKNVTAAVGISSDKILYCMDSETDDYDVSDGAYGLIKGKITGTVQGAPGYLEVTDTKGVSFHRLQMAVSHVSFRPSVVGMYYTGSFAGDQVVAGQVLEYGIALNAYEAPNEQNIAEGGTSLCVSYTTPWESTSQIAGAMLQNIMKPTNEVMLNISNAGDKVYGRAYIRTADGYIFSDTASYSLRELVEYADEYKYIQGNAIAEMAKLYEQYQPVLDLWNLPRLRMQLAELEG